MITSRTKYGNSEFAASCARATNNEKNFVNLLQDIATNSATPLNRLAFEPILHSEQKYEKFENVLWSLL